MKFMQDKSRSILHVALLDKIFIPKFIDFVRENFSDKQEHKFLLYSKKLTGALRIDEKTLLIPEKNYKFFLKEAKRSKKIILHGLWNNYINHALDKYDRFLDKTFWITWGGDFSPARIQPTVRKNLIKKIKNIITDNYYDFLYIKEKYENKDAKLYRCFGYTSNIFNLEITQQNLQHTREDNTVNILIGNSADPFHEHIKVLKSLEKYKDEKIKIYVPLSYCLVDELYVKEVINVGKNIFKENFIPIREFMPYDEYIKFLAKIDIAIFAAKRQQAMGNIIALLGLGKKVYLDSNVTTFKMFLDMGIKVYDVDEFNLQKIDSKVAEQNSEKIKSYYSKENLINQWNNIFES